MGDSAGFDEMPLLVKIGFGIGGVAVAIFILWLLGTWCASCLDFTGHKYVATRPCRRDDHDKASTDPDGDSATDSSYDDYASDSDDDDDDSASLIHRSRHANRCSGGGRGGASPATSTDEESPTS